MRQRVVVCVFFEFGVGVKGQGVNGGSAIFSLVWVFAIKQMTNLGGGRFAEPLALVEGPGARP